jgi:hypothetical protein
VGLGGICWIANCLIFGSWCKKNRIELGVGLGWDSDVIALIVYIMFMCSSAVALAGTLQACRARSCATGAGPFCSTQEVLRACVARYAMQSPMCRLQVACLGFGFSCFLVEHQRHAHCLVGRKGQILDLESC